MKKITLILGLVLAMYCFIQIPSAKAASCTAFTRVCDRCTSNDCCPHDIYSGYTYIKTIYHNGPITFCDTLWGDCT